MKMSKRNIFILILSIITVSCIIVGTSYHVFKYKNYKDDVELVEYEDRTIIPSFNSLIIDGYIMDIEVTTGDSYSYDISYNHNSLEPIVKIDGDALVIKQRKKPKNIGQTQICKAIVTIPFNEKLNKIDIESNIGEVTVDCLSAKEVIVNTNIGHINLIDLDSEKIKGESNIGKVEIDVLGSIKDYNIDLETNLGETKVNGRTLEKEYSSYSDSSKEIKIETNIGEINLYQ